MGGKDSKYASHGNIFIQMKEGTHNAGAIMEGVVHLDLTRPYPARSLKLVFEGNESVNW